MQNFGRICTINTPIQVLTLRTFQTLISTMKEAKLLV